MVDVTGKEFQVHIHEAWKASIPPPYNPLNFTLKVKKYSSTFGGPQTQHHELQHHHHHRSNNAYYTRDTPDSLDLHRFDNGTGATSSLNRVFGSRAWRPHLAKDTQLSRNGL